MSVRLPSPVKGAAAPALTAAPAGLAQRRCTCGGPPGLAGECDGCRRQRLVPRQPPAPARPPLSRTPPRVQRSPADAAPGVDEAPAPPEAAPAPAVAPPVQERVGP